ncbi:MAG TPA: methyltransferase domain-containing protein [Kiritimatiellia bacterium]|nr:methyltransferase domain-containing protein [Kiritimatiellia bacterium]
MIEPQSFEYVNPDGVPYLSFTEFNASPVHRNRLTCIINMLHASGPPSCNHVLEIGCGVGNVAMPIASEGYQITAIDIHGPSVETARRRNTFANLQVVHKPFEEMPLAEFDTVILTEVLEHVPDCNNMMANICGAMRPGARLILTVPNGWSRAEVLFRPSYILKRSPTGAGFVKLVKHVLGVRDMTTANEQTPHVHFFTLRQLEHLFNHLGMTVTIFHRYFISWLLREAVLSERGIDEAVPRRDFERSQRAAPHRCALWAFLLEKNAPSAG